MIISKYTPKHLFSEEIEGIIWKIILDDIKEIILIESRTTDKQVFFYAYDFKKNNFLFKKKQFNEEWFIGLLGIYNGIAFFHGYENEFSPSTKNIFALDVENNIILWESYTHAAEQIFEEGILVYNAKIQPKRFELLDANTGLLLQNIKAEDVKKLTIINNAIILPKNYYNLELEKSYQELIYNDLIIKSEYKKEESSYKQLITISKNDNLIFTDFLNNDIQKLHQDTFFMWQSRLIYIKNKTKIVSYLV